jgi:TP901 family phage tail tape measure protein
VAIGGAEALIAKIGADISAFEREVNKMPGAADKVSKKAAKSFSVLNKTIAGIGISVAGMVAGVSLAVKKFADFQLQMNKVEAVTQANQSQMKELTRTARELGATTAFTAKEAAQGMSFLGQAGFKTNQILAAIPDTLNLAAAGALGLGEAADIASNVLSGFQIRAEETSRVVDVLALAAASSNTDVRQLGEAMSFVSGRAKNVGLSLEETTAAIGLLGNVGIQGSRAGTNLGAALGKILKGSESLSPRVDALRISLIDANTGGVLPLVEIIQKLEKANLSAAETMQLFGERGERAISALTTAGSEELSRFISNLNEADGAGKRMAETMQKGLPGAFKSLSSAVDDVLISIGEDLGPTLEKLIVNELIPMVRQLGDMVKALGGVDSAFGKLTDNQVLIVTFFQAIGKTILDVATFIGRAAKATAEFFGIIEKQKIKFGESFQGKGSREPTEEERARFRIRKPGEVDIETIKKETEKLLELAKSQARKQVEIAEKTSEDRIEIIKEEVDFMRRLAEEQKGLEDLAVTNALEKSLEEFNRITLPIELDKSLAEFEQFGKEVNAVNTNMEKEQKSKIGDMIRNWADMGNESIDIMGKVEEGVIDIFTTIKSTVSDLFFDFFKGELKTLKDLFSRTFNAVLRIISTILAQIVVQAVLQTAIVKAAIKAIATAIDNVFGKAEETVKEKLISPLVTATATVLGLTTAVKGLGFAFSSLRAPSFGGGGFLSGITGLLGLGGGGGGGGGFGGGTGGIFGGGGGINPFGVASSLANIGSTLTSTGAASTPGIAGFGTSSFGFGPSGGAATGGGISGALSAAAGPLAAAGVGFAGGQLLAGPLGLRNQLGASIGGAVGSGAGFAIGGSLASLASLGAFAGPVGALVGGLIGIVGGGLFGSKGSSSARRVSKVEEFYQNALSIAGRDMAGSMRWIRDAMHIGQVSPKIIPALKQVGNENWYFRTLAFLNRSFGSQAGGGQFPLNFEKLSRIVRLIDEGEMFNFNKAGGRAFLASMPVKTMAGALNKWINSGGLARGIEKGKFTAEQIEGLFSGTGGGAPSGVGGGNQATILPLQRGGIVTGNRTVFSMMGENGTREAVIPLTESNLRMIGGGGGSGMTINIEINNSMLDAESAKRADWKRITREQIFPQIRDTLAMQGQGFRGLEVFR